MAVCGERRGKPWALLGSVAITVSAVALPQAAAGAPRTATPTTVAAGPQTAPVGGAGSPPSLSPDPVVPGAPGPRSLLDQALTLSVDDAATAPLQGRISAVSARLTADLVAVGRAQAEAAAAERTELRAQRAAVSARQGFASLHAALEKATIRLYMSGSVTLPGGDPVGSNALADATVYAQTTLTPSGVLAQRREDLRLESANFARARSASFVATAAAARAAQAADAAASQRQALTKELATLSAATAARLDAEHQDLAAQAATELLSAKPLQFVPAKPLPAPLTTTSVALDWLFSELGRPYVYGGTGPATFDCSGLTQFVWGRAGVVIPRVAADQDSWSVPVPLSQLMPGDLVFYGTTDIHHVGMYIGGGLMIDAPHTGTVVQVSSIWWTDLAGFGRVHAPGIPVPSHILPSASSPAPPAVVPTAGAVPAQLSPPPGTSVQGSLPEVAVGTPSSRTSPATTVPGDIVTTGPSTTVPVAPSPTTATTSTTVAPTTTTTSPVQTTSTTTAGSISSTSSTTTGRTSR